jgi:predicted dehydrogenase/nucleoside-diphosphate-sugar epimerase
VKELRIAIVGCGRVAEQHARYVASSPNANLAALVDPDRARAADLAKRYGAQHSFGSIEDLLRSLPVDVVHLCSPPSEHFQQACEALSRGVSVFVEKPVSFSSRETELLYEMAAENGASVCPNFIQSFLPCMRKAARLVESGQLGQPLSVSCTFSVDPQLAQLKESLDPHWSLQLPGGPLHNFVTHPLYLVLYWLGPLRRIAVFPRAQGVLPQGMTDHADILLEGASANGHITLSFAARPCQQLLTLSCERGTVQVNLSTLTVMTDRHGLLPGFVDRAAGPFLQAATLAGQHLATLYKVARGRILPYQGLQNLLPAYYESITNHTPPPVQRELVIEVSKAEEEIIGQLGKTRFSMRSPGRLQAAIHPIVVTGAAGYLGQEVVKALVARGEPVRAFVRAFTETHALEKLGAEVVWGDIRDPQAVSEALRGAAAVVHLAAGLRGSPRFMRETCVEGTANIAAAARGMNVGHVVYVSSVAVYDIDSVGEGGVITELTPLEKAPEERGASSAAKREAEDIALREAQESGWTILRPAVIFGNGRDLAALLGARMGALVLALGSRRKPLRLVHASDVAQAIVQVLSNPAARGQLFNLAHPDRLRAKDLVRIWRSDGRGPKPRVLYVPYSVAAGARLLLRAGRLFSRRIPAVSKKRINYLFKGLIVGSERIAGQLNWRPSAPLHEQLHDACGAGSPSFTAPWNERPGSASGSRIADGPCAGVARATLSPVRQSNP